MSKNSQFSAIRSNSKGCIAIRVELTSGWGGAHVAVKGRGDISVVEARSLAASLTALADAADAKEAKEAKLAEGRMKWRDREIAAGRMVLF